MIRFSEAVLPGHPDKFCDQIADAIIAEAMSTDAEAFAQVEIGVWSDEIWMSGKIVTRRKLVRSPSDLLLETGLALGFDQSNWIDTHQYKITDTICQIIDDPTEARAVCDDQAIVIGYAGYDRKTHYLPPEQFLVHKFREALWQACCNGILSGAGPDGKLLVRIKEEGRSWQLEQILVTMQHRLADPLLDVTGRVIKALEAAYITTRDLDSRWSVPWQDVSVLINPNGPYLRAGSDGDNGQTGRKLVMDYYGPRVPIGGGALSGKHPSHIDRMAAYSARSAAIHAVKTGARECLIRLADAPNRDKPIGVVWEMEAKGEQRPNSYFAFGAMLDRVIPETITRQLGSGTHFWDLSLPWNS